ncbi:MAG: hypothetical protein NTX97_10955, partial [Bacteroidetes bacterium]|nr:hypothetical protein [Bacteroidota bacterium]
NTMCPHPPPLPMENHRKLTMLTCEWCKRRFCSERADSKYCCDSHKTLACDKRRNEKRNKRHADEEYLRRWRIKQKEKEKLAAIAPTSPSKPPENNFNNQYYVDGLKEINEMLDKNKQEQKLRDEKYEFE